VLNAKGGEIKVKANGSATTCEILKIVELELLICQNALICKIWSLDLSKYSNLQNLVSCGENVWLWEKGEFLALDQFFSWNSSLYA
jgi:hypothetical protein